jgi:hypothetical protein
MHGMTPRANLQGVAKPFLRIADLLTDGRRGKRDAKHQNEYFPKDMRSHTFGSDVEDTYKMGFCPVDWI